jgi:hypothetical protein
MAYADETKDAQESFETSLDRMRRSFADDFKPLRVRRLEDYAVLHAALATFLKELDENLVDPKSKGVVAFTLRTMRPHVTGLLQQLDSKWVDSNPQEEDGE